MLGELSGEKESGSGLDVTGTDGLALVVASKFGGLGSNLLEHLVAKGVHDGHALGRDPGVRVHLLQNLVDEPRVSLLPALLLGVRVLRRPPSASLGRDGDVG